MQTVGRPVFVFIPGAWHQPSCYHKVIRILQDEHGYKCVSITLPTTLGNPNATFKDDYDAARNAIIQETIQGHDVVVIAHSYGGMVGNSAIRDLTPPKASGMTSLGKKSPAQQPTSGYVRALVLIASGFTLTGWAFLDMMGGRVPPFFRLNKDTGFSDLAVNPRQFFYHDLSDDEADFWVKQLTEQSSKALLEGREYAYAGWKDVPTWYIGTIQDQGLPVMTQRMAVGMARGQGAVVFHTELDTSHSPFLSTPEKVADTILETVVLVGNAHGQNKNVMDKQVFGAARVEFLAPRTWLSLGIPLLFGRMIGWCFAGFTALQTLLRGK